MNNKKDAGSQINADRIKNGIMDKQLVTTKTSHNQSNQATFDCRQLITITNN